MPRLHAPSKEDSRLLPPFSALPERCIHVPATDAEFAAARAALMAAPVLGFDTESKPLFHASQTDTGEAKPARGTSRREIGHGPLPAQAQGGFGVFAE